MPRGGSKEKKSPQPAVVKTPAVDQTVY